MAHLQSRAMPQERYLLGADWCTLVQHGAVYATLYILVQLSAHWCNMVQFGATWCSLVQLGADWCKLVQISAIWCSLV